MPINSGLPDWATRYFASFTIRSASASVNSLLRSSSLESTRLSFSSVPKMPVCFCSLESLDCDCSTADLS